MFECSFLQKEAIGGRRHKGENYFKLSNIIYTGTYTILGIFIGKNKNIKFQIVTFGRGVKPFASVGRIPKYDSTRVPRVVPNETKCSAEYGRRKTRPHYPGPAAGAVRSN